ncbi:MAG TPA: RNA-binding protein [Thermoanaerobaculia bacterium]|jgi:RNA recognition motif-containing protein|nr:RNA-binding protein [Thermoanaerobaculia bacterium]
MGKKLFVGNLNFKTNDDDLRQLFSQAGTCESATVMMDRATGRSRGFGFVEMATDEEAQKAVQQFNGYEFQGRNLNVNEARERTPGGPRGGGYGGGYSGGRGGYGGERGGGYGADFNPGPSFGGGDDFGGGSPGFGGGFNRGNFKPRKEGGSRRGLRAKKRSL